MDYRLEEGHVVNCIISYSYTDTVALLYCSKEDTLPSEMMVEWWMDFQSFLLKKGDSKTKIRSTSWKFRWLLNCTYGYSSIWSTNPHFFRIWNSSNFFHGKVYSGTDLAFLSTHDLRPFKGNCDLREFCGCSHLLKTNKHLQKIVNLHWNVVWDDFLSSHDFTMANRSTVPSGTVPPKARCLTMFLFSQSYELVHRDIAMFVHVDIFLATGGTSITFLSMYMETHKHDSEKYGGSCLAATDIYLLLLGHYSYQTSVKEDHLFQDFLTVELHGVHETSANIDLSRREVIRIRRELGVQGMYDFGLQVNFPFFWFLCWRRSMCRFRHVSILSVWCVCLIWSGFSLWSCWLLVLVCVLLLPCPVFVEVGFEGSGSHLASAYSILGRTVVGHPFCSRTIFFETSKVKTVKTFKKIIIKKLTG